MAGMEFAELLGISEVRISRTRALLFVFPFTLLGIANVLLLLNWGLNPLWGVMVLPPILFVSMLGWIAFRSGFTHHDAASNPKS